MHYSFHILFHWIVVWNLGNGGHSAKTAVSPEVLTTFAKNIASVLSPGLLSDFQNLSTNRTSSTPVSQRKSKDAATPYIIRSRRSEPNEESSNINLRGLNLNVNQKTSQNRADFDNGIAFSNDISDVRSIAFRDNVNERPVRYTNRYRLPDIFYKPGHALAQLSNLDGNTQSYHNARFNPRKIDVQHQNLRDAPTIAEKLKTLEVDKEEGVTSSSNLRLAPRSPIDSYNRQYTNRRTYAPVYRQAVYNARQESVNTEDTTSDPGNTETAPNTGTFEKPSYGGYGFQPYGHFPGPFYGGPHPNFPPYGNSHDGVNSTDEYHGFRGYGFDPYQPFNRHPDFYGHRPSYLPAESSGSSEKPEENQSDDNSSVNGSSNKYPYGYQGYPFNPPFGFPFHGFDHFKGPNGFDHFKGPFGPFPDSFKKGFPHHGLQHEPFPFFPQPHFHPPYGGYYPNHNFRGVHSPSTTPSEPVSQNPADLESPQTVSESLLNTGDELISESVQRDLIHSRNDNGMKNEADERRIIKRFVFIGSDRYRD